MDSMHGLNVLPFFWHFRRKIAQVPWLVRITHTHIKKGVGAIGHLQLGRVEPMQERSDCEWVIWIHSLSAGGEGDADDIPSNVFYFPLQLLFGRC